VLTAYSGKEGMEIFEKHPLDAVVVHASISDVPCGKLVGEMKNKKPDTPVVVISPTLGQHCDSADRHIGSHNPQELLQVLNEIIAA
jgi:DNA-binding response OmpR family regulator